MSSKSTILLPHPLDSHTEGSWPHMQNSLQQLVRLTELLQLAVDRYLRIIHAQSEYFLKHVCSVVLSFM